jgi:hypothetical protein
MCGAPCMSASRCDTPPSAAVSSQQRFVSMLLPRGCARVDVWYKRGLRGSKQRGRCWARGCSAGGPTPYDSRWRATRSLACAMWPALAIASVRSRFLPVPLESLSWGYEEHLAEATGRGLRASHWRFLVDRRCGELNSAACPTSTLVSSGALTCADLPRAGGLPVRMRGAA